MKSIDKLDILMNIKDDPIKYLGQISLEKLEQFIHGYCQSLFQYNISVEIGEYNWFWTYITMKYKVNRTSAEQIIINNSKNDEEAFHNYFKELEEFKKLPKVDEKNILMEIKNNPEKYLGKASLENMQQFLNGYYRCLHEYYIFQRDRRYDKFNIYIQKKYNVWLTLSSANIISFFSENDEEAFYNYFKELEEFEKLTDEELEELTYENLREVRKSEKTK